MTTVVHRVVIRGQVQGVGFRVWTEAMANRCGLQGWVRNRRDGSVEALFAGAQEQVAAMIELCRVGPLGARVESIDQREASAEDLALRRAGESFSVLSSV